LKIVTAYYPTPAVGGSRIVYIEPVFKLNDYNSDMRLNSYRYYLNTINKDKLPWFMLFVVRIIDVYEQETEIGNENFRKY